MKTAKDFELPDRLKDDYRKAKKLEYWTLAYMVSVVILMYLTMSTSEAMRTAWAEDMLTLLAPISFLVASKVAIKPPSKKFPYGFHRSNTIAFLVSSVTLAVLGIILIYNGVSALVKQEHPTIGTVRIFGELIWLGWLMIIVLIYSAIGPFILGIKKLPVAKKIHNKVLYADAKTNKADYLTALAAIAGIIGIGFGLWWADAVAALVISVDIVKDGFSQTKNAITDLLSRTPKKVDEKEYDPVVFDLKNMLLQLDWVDDVEVRLREEGQVYFGEAFLVPHPNVPNLLKRIDEASREATEMNWQIFDLTISVTEKIRGVSAEEHPDRS